MSESTRYPNRLLTLSFGIAILASVFLPTNSQAELTSYFGSALLKEDGQTRWAGTTSLFDSTSVPDVDVYYAVYDRATFITLFGSVLSNNDAYVYTYQLDNDDLSPQAIGKFTVGLYAGALASAQAELNDPQYGIGSPASLVYFATGNTSAIWNYSGTKKILAGGKSKILLFTSPHGPVDGKTCSVSAPSAVGESGPVPTPSSVPEPSMLIMLLIINLCFVAFRPLRSMFS
jgi:hypothetical protein